MTSTESTAAPATTTASSSAAPVPAAGGSPAVSTGASSSPDWTAGIQSEDLRGWAQNKGYKDVPTAVEAHRNLEKLLGVPADRVIKLPENREDAVAMGDIYAKLGRPEKPEGYKIEVPEGGSKEFAEWAQKNFHENGLSTRQGQALIGKWNEFVAGAQKAQAEAVTAKTIAAENALKKEWGAAFDQNSKVAARGARSVGIDADTMDAIESAIGYDKTMKLFHGFGSKTGEDSFVSGGGGSGNGFGVMTPDAAKSQIKAKREDMDFVKRYTSRESSAVAEMDRLHRMAYPQE